MKRLFITFLFLLYSATSFASDTKPNHPEENSDDDNVTTDRGQYVDSNWDKEDKRNDNENEEDNNDSQEESKDEDQNKDQYVDSGWDDADKKEENDEVPEDYPLDSNGETNSEDPGYK